MDVSQFVSRWKDSGGAELANSQSFLKELCDLLDVPQPEPTKPDESQNSYVFEKAVRFNNGDGTTSDGRVDLYRKSSFVLESKQGVERKEAEQIELLSTQARSRRLRAGTAQRGTPGWELAMNRARQQAKRYAEAIEGEWPPFLVIVDIGHCFDLYADFSQTGKNYVPFPDPQSFRIRLADFEKEETRTTFRTIWLDPLSLDPARRSAKITREVAERLAKLAKSMEGQHTPEQVSHFLMQCLFAMFAEDVEIGGITKGRFTNFLKSRRGKLDTFVPMLQSLWETMNTGGFSTVLEGHIRQFNGGIFHEPAALPVTDDQLELLIEAAEMTWTEVEPAIFGTLLERALDPVDRHKLGAHYTPRAYVERLVMPTIIEPLRDQWDTVYATAVALFESGKLADARKSVRDFHEQLCEIRILDPACGSGNFLYVSLELMKRLEGEVLKALSDLGDKQDVLLTIDPHQFLGIEVNPRAAAIADLVLWIGYLQWHIRARGRDDFKEPIIKAYDNIECRDAVLDWDSVETVTDSEGNSVTRWDGRTTKPHPITGEEVPDETARIEELRYINPRETKWPIADYIVGNPPFIGNKRMNFSLGAGYTSCLRDIWGGVPGSADYVMYWWNLAAESVAAGECRRFGLITTNSITQTFNRAVVSDRLNSPSPFQLAYAIPDHPWVDSTDGAAVRVAMTVGTKGSDAGKLLLINAESEPVDGAIPIEFKTLSGKINASLRIGFDLAQTSELQGNQGLAFTGMYPLGQGFVLAAEEKQIAIGTDRESSSVVKPYRTARDLVQTNRENQIIDFYPLPLDEAQKRYPSLLQWVIERVKPERDQNRVEERRRNWWLFTRPIPKLRDALTGVKNFIVVPRTAKHFVFQFISAGTIVDTTIVAIVVDSPAVLGLLSSRIHQVWALASGGRLEDRPRYQHQQTFNRFPFPSNTSVETHRICEFANQLDSHRKSQQELHSSLTMTGIYNVLEKLRSGEKLTAKDKKIHDDGLVSVLKQIHDDLDAAVFDSYGWPHDLTDEQILERLVALNHERAEEESRGLIRWLRPDFQNPNQESGITLPKNDDDDDDDDAGKKTKSKKEKAKKQPWPASLRERVEGIRSVLSRQKTPSTASEIAKQFTRAKVATVEEILENLVAIGYARQTDDGRFAE